MIASFRKHCDEVGVLPYHISNGFMITPVLDIDAATICTMGERLEEIIRRTMAEMAWATNCVAVKQVSSEASIDTKDLTARIDSSYLSHTVSVRSVYQIKPEQKEAAIATAKCFQQRLKEDRASITEKKEVGNLYYDWALNPDETRLICREGYVDASAVEAHLAHVGDLFLPFLNTVDLAEAEVIGPQSQVEILKRGPMQGWNALCVYYSEL